MRAVRSGLIGTWGLRCGPAGCTIPGGLVDCAHMADLMSALMID